MQKPQPITDSTELLHRLSRLSSEAEWTTEEVQEALREGGVDPEQLVCRVLTQVKRLLQESPAPSPQDPADAPEASEGEASLPLLGELRQRTRLPPSAIAQAMKVPVTFLSAVARYPKAVPESWQQELAARAEHTLRVDRRIVLRALTHPGQYEMAASRDTPYSTEAVSYEEILAQAGMSPEATQFWRTLAMEKPST